MKQRAHVIANCQVRALEHALEASEAFTSRYELVKLPPVHVMSKDHVEQLHRSLPATDLLIVQFITEGYRDAIGLGTQTLKTLLSPTGIAVTWPSIYWAGYNPELFYLKDADGRSVTEHFDYHHRPVFSAYVSGETAESLTATLFDPSRFQASRTAADQALDDLAKREASLDVKVADYIAERHRHERLFWTFNHPAQSVLLHVARQVLHLLGVPDDLPAAPSTEPLSGTVYPVLPSVRDALRIGFDVDDRFVVRGKAMTTRELVDGYYSLYERRPDLVDMNRPG